MVFMLSARGRDVEGAVARAALEEHFWLPAGADPARTLKAFEDGRNRIVAAAQRKLLARPDEPLWLDRQRLPDPVSDRWLTMTIASMCFRQS